MTRSAFTKSRWLTFALCAVAGVLLIVRLAPHGWRRAPAASPRAKGVGSGNPYVGLRGMVLEGSRANFGLGPGASPTQPFAVVTDWGEAQGSTTIIAIADGSASVYSSNGSAWVGGGQAHESIRNAALKTVQAAEAVQPQMQRTSEYPPAKSGQVSFYVVTDAGVFTAVAPEAELTGNRSPLSPLAAATRNILTEYRWTEPGR